MTEFSARQADIAVAIQKMTELLREHGEKIARLEMHEIRRLKLERQAQLEQDPRHYK